MRHRTLTQMQYIQVTLMLTTGISMLSACNAPESRTEEERFFIEPEILEAVHPYLQSWSMLPPEATESERGEIGARFGVTINAYPLYALSPSTDGAVSMIQIPLENWHDWERGMMYIPVDKELDSLGGTQLKLVEKYIYAYNVSY